MKIDKAIKKEKRNKKIFFIFMILLAILLPTLTYLSYIKALFILIFLSVIEILIVIALINKVNYYNLNFTCINNRLRFKSGIFKPYVSMKCDKVIIVHTNKSYDEMEVIIVTTKKSKGKATKVLTRDFMKNNKELYQEYLRLKNIENDEKYYFQVIKNGALNKYILLDNIYKNCVNASYTTSAIENIKIARGQNEI